MLPVVISQLRGGAADAEGSPMGLDSAQHVSKSVRAGARKEGLQQGRQGGQALRAEGLVVIQSSLLKPAVKAFGEVTGLADAALLLLLFRGGLGHQ
jgi:hypothetical protein